MHGIDLQSSRLRFSLRLLQTHFRNVEAGHVPPFAPGTSYSSPAPSRHRKLSPASGLSRPDQKRVRAKIDLRTFRINAVVKLAFLAKSFALDSNDRIFNRGASQAVLLAWLYNEIRLVLRGARRSGLSHSQYASASLASAVGAVQTTTASTEGCLRITTPEPFS